MQHVFNVMRHPKEQVKVLHSRGIMVRPGMTASKVGRFWSESFGRLALYLAGYRGCPYATFSERSTATSKPFSNLRGTMPCQNAPMLFTV